MSSVPIHLKPGDDPVIVRECKVIEVRDQKDVRAEFKCVKAGTGSAPAEYDLLLYLYQPEPFSTEPWPPEPAKCAACPHAEHGHRECGAMWDERNACTCTEWRPGYILAIRAQALDEVQELIQPGDEPWVDPPLPTQEQWERIVIAAFPPPPMAGA